MRDTDNLCFDQLHTPPQDLVDLVVESHDLFGVPRAEEDVYTALQCTEGIQSLVDLVYFTLQPLYWDEPEDPRRQSLGFGQQQLERDISGMVHVDHNEVVSAPDDLLAPRE